MCAARFHYPHPLTSHSRLELPDDLAHHAVRVLRLRHGTPIVLFDGEGGQYPAVLEVEGKRAWAQLGQHQDREAELPARIVLVQGIAGGDKMDWIVEKAVEMGVSEFVPIAAQRSVVQLSGERRAKRVQHWRRVAVAASEQCGRNRIMTVAEPQSLEQWLLQAPAELPCLACHPDATADFADAVQGHDNGLALMIGPEGGWSDEELSLMADRGLTAVRFGLRILRTETAGIALMAALAAIKRWQ